MATPKFLNVSGSTFYQELKGRVSDYFTQSKKPSTGNFGLYFKAVLFWVSYVPCIFMSCFLLHRYGLPSLSVSLWVD